MGQRLGDGAECHYRADVGGGTLLSVWFHVSLFADGRKWVRAVVENGYLDDGAGAFASNVDRSYIPTVTIGGVVVYNNGGVALDHYKRASWTAEGWIGGDPQITPEHDVEYLRASKIFPNYGWAPPSEAMLSGDVATAAPSISGQFHMLQTYTPMSNGDNYFFQPDTGYQAHIGLLPLYDALYLTSGDARAWRCMIANHSHYRSFPLGWRDFTTKLPVKPSAFADWSTSGPGAGGDARIDAGPLAWEDNHHGSAGFTAYVLTGDYWHYETLLLQASMIYLACGQGSGRGTGTNRHVWQQTRGYAWNLRTLSQIAAIYPTGDAVAAEYQTLLSSNIDWLKTFVDDPATKPLGILFDYGWAAASLEDPLSHPSGATSVTAPWAHEWLTAAVGIGSDLEPLADPTNLIIVRDWLYKYPVGLLGPTGSGNYHFTRAGMYHADMMGLPLTSDLLWARFFARQIAA
jgi:hypothetical protein